MEGNGKIFCCCHKKLDTFGKAHGLLRATNIVFAVYMITIPFMKFVEFSLELSDNTKEGDFSYAVLIRLYILVVTLSNTAFIQSFMLSFKKIAPFLPLNNQLVTILFLSALFDLVGGILRTIQVEIGDYDEYQTYSLLFSCVFAWIVLMLAVCQLFALNPVILKDNESKSLIYSTEIEELDQDDKQDQNGDKETDQRKDAYDLDKNKGGSDDEALDQDVIQND